MSNPNSMIATQIAEKIFGKKQAGEIPTILCRRIMPMPLTYNLKDYGWEGLRRIFGQDGQPSMEIYHDFILEIDGSDGTCSIPDTRVNRAQLDRMSKPTITMGTRIEWNAESGERVEVPTKITHPPMYEIIEQNMLSDDVVKDLADKVLEEVSKRMAGKPDAYAAQTEAPREYVEPEAETSFRPLPKSEVIQPKRGEKIDSMPKKSNLLAPIGERLDDNK